MKKGVLRNSTKFTGKHLRQSPFFNKNADLRPAALLKKRLWHRCFPVNFAKFLRTPFLQKNSGRLREKWSCSELFLSPFSRIRTDTERYLVRMQENADQNNSEYGQFLNSSQDQKIVSAGEIIFGSLGTPWVDHL